MDKYGGLVTASLLVIGTAGLLLNEFLLGWGTVATITFALFNVIGIVIVRVEQPLMIMQVKDMLFLTGM